MAIRQWRRYTYLWLIVLLITTIIARHLTRREYHTVVMDGSTA